MRIAGDADGIPAERGGGNTVRLVKRDGNGICVVEWSENISSVLPENAKIVTIEKLGDDKRKIIL